MAGPVTSAGATPPLPLAPTIARERPRIAVAAGIVVSLRPRQWTKNLLVFAGVIFAAKVGDAARWTAAIEVFVAYCCASSAAYLLNDVRDVERDQTHPVKQRRPIASGTVPIPLAAAASMLLMATAAGIASMAGRNSLLLLVLFLVGQAAYSLRLKHVVLVDVLVISGLFVVRATAGAVASDVRISPWLLLCTGLLALFLALSKRRAELASGRSVHLARPALQDYSLQLVDQLVLIATTSTITSYALYTFTARESKALMVTIPFVIFGLFRYLLLADRDGLGEEPDNVLLTDVPLLLCIAAWIGTAAVVLVIA